MDLTVQHFVFVAQGRVVQAIKLTVGRPFVWAGVLKVAHDIVMFLSPYILERLLHALSMPVVDRGVTAGLAFAMLAAAVAETMSVNVYFHVLYRISLHLKAR